MLAGPSLHTSRFHGVMVSTLDSESSDPSSNLGGTYQIFFNILIQFSNLFLFKVCVNWGSQFIVDPISAPIFKVSKMSNHEQSDVIVALKKVFG